MKTELKAQIRQAVETYPETDPKAAMLSGMALVASYLAKLDGSKKITPAVVLSAIADVGKEYGFAIGPLK